MSRFWSMQTSAEVPLEEKKKLNFFERRAMKKLIQKAHKQLDKHILSLQSKADAHAQLSKALLDLTDVLEIEYDKGEHKGKLLSKDNISSCSTEELQDILESALQEMEKLI